MFWHAPEDFSQISVSHRAASPPYEQLAIGRSQVGIDRVAICAISMTSFVTVTLVGRGSAAGHLFQTRDSELDMA